MCKIDPQNFCEKIPEIFFYFGKKYYICDEIKTPIKNNTMNTLNEIRAARLIAILSKELEEYHNNLLDLQRLAEHFEIQPCKAKKIYRTLINRVQIDTHRIYLLADKYFNHSGSVPKDVDGYTIYRLSDFSYFIKWFEL